MSETQERTSSERVLRPKGKTSFLKVLQEQKPRMSQQMEMSKLDAPRGPGTRIHEARWILCSGSGTEQGRGKLQLGPPLSRGLLGGWGCSRTQTPKRLCGMNGADGGSARENGPCHPTRVCVLGGAEEARCLAGEDMGSSTA